MIGSLFESLLSHDKSRSHCFKHLMKALPAFQQRAVLLSVMHYLDSQYLSRTAGGNISMQDQNPAEVVNDCAALIKSLTEDSNMLIDYIAELCVKVENSILIRSFTLRRVVLASLSGNDGRLQLCIGIESPLMQVQNKWRLLWRRRWQNSVISFSSTMRQLCSKKVAKTLTSVFESC
jgi:hypothetical protein